MYALISFALVVVCMSMIVLVTLSKNPKHIEFSVGRNKFSADFYKQLNSPR